MRKIREVLARLNGLGLARRQMVRSCSIVQSSIHKYLRLAEAPRIRWPLPGRPLRLPTGGTPVRQAICHTRPTAPPRAPPPGHPSGTASRQAPHPPSVLVRLQAPVGYRYSRFCDLVRELCNAQKLTLRQAAQPRRKLLADYARVTITIQNCEAGEIHQASASSRMIFNQQNSNVRPCRHGSPQPSATPAREVIRLRNTNRPRWAHTVSHRKTNVQSRVKRKVPGL